jgi:phenylalanine-4-hydroxylase
VTGRYAPIPASRVREQVSTIEASAGTVRRGRLHLADDHPGANDPTYRARRNEIAAAATAWRPGQLAPRIVYKEAEHHLWQTVCRELFPKYERYAIAEFREGVERLGLPRDHVPNLDDVSARLKPLTGFRYVPAAGHVKAREFYGPLRERVFQATQFVRHSAAPRYTPEPDIIHEVIGHGHLLATPLFSELHRMAGEATHRLRDVDNLEFLSKVFWFSLEFGVVIEDGSPRAYGAGLLSSFGELEEFRGSEHRPLELVKMGTTTYDVTAYQPILYRAESLDEVHEVVGGFFATCTDESIAELRADAAADGTGPGTWPGVSTPRESNTCGVNTTELIRPQISPATHDHAPHRVVVGGGVGGLQAALKLAPEPVEVMLVDGRNFHPFQPLAYQVATGAPLPGESCFPLRAVCRDHRNVRVLLAQVTGFDLASGRVELRAMPAPASLKYDSLIVAGRAHGSYFGHGSASTRPWCRPALSRSERVAPSGWCSYCRPSTHHGSTAIGSSLRPV